VSNYNERFYAWLNHGDGTVSLVLFKNSDFVPGVSVLHQLENAVLVDRMPLNEALELSAGGSAAVALAGRQYVQAIQEASQHKAPLDSLALVKFAAMLEGICLDPMADADAVQQGLIRGAIDAEPPVGDI